MVFNLGYEKTYLGVPVEAMSNHCPLCHSTIPPWEDGWRQHLISLPCPNHPRRKHIKSLSSQLARIRATRIRRHVVTEFIRQERNPHLRGWRESRKPFRKNHPSLPDRDTNLDIPVPSSLAQHKTSALANYATKVGRMV
uniref:Uncharacterized protein n=1 Tax=Timema monikensis TaxID=170555 RepID=A0A7R9DX46_9NEOP|nr:unnamed protein product [Timema monikensis]